MIHLFTTLYGYRDDPGLWKFLRLSAKKCGVEIHGYGGRAVPNYYQMRILDMITYLESIQDEYVLYCDSRDSLIVYWDPAKALGILESYGKPLLLQSERNCWPWLDLKEKYPVVSTPYKYLNAGGIFGERRYLLEKLYELKKFHEGLGAKDEQQSDQGLWSINYVDTQSFALDHECKVFQSFYLAEEGDFSVEGRRLKNKYFPASEPMIGHFNGNWPGIKEYYKKLYV